MDFIGLTLFKSRDKIYIRTSSFISIQCYVLDEFGTKGSEIYYVEFESVKIIRVTEKSDVIAERINNLQNNKEINNNE